MSGREKFDGDELAAIGLNLQAVIDLDTLTPDIIAQLQSVNSEADRYEQLILLGHGGRLFWQKLNEAGFEGEHPIDDYSRKQVTDFFSRRYLPGDFSLVFPLENQAAVGLQSLGILAAWHHDTPMRLGINRLWGSWFAYRAVVLARSNYLATPPLAGDSPCEKCADKPCVAACPVMPDAERQLDIARCVDERKRIGTRCRDRCLARLACPVASEHAYSLDQVQYHYLRSMRVIESMK